MQVERDDVAHEARVAPSVVGILVVALFEERLQLQVDVERRLDVDVGVVPPRVRVAPLADAAEVAAEVVPLQHYMHSSESLETSPEAAQNLLRTGNLYGIQIFCNDRKSSHFTLP